LVKGVKSISRLVLFLCVLLALFCGYARLAVMTAAHNRVYVKLEQVPHCRIALVLGCAPTVGKQHPNLFFENRISAAASLFQSGKVERLLVSGDNRRAEYNEPEAMKKALIQRGVPEEAIVCDFAGRRTLDSVARAEKIFGLTDYLIVSQHDHVERALYLANQRAIGFAAPDVPMTYSLRNDVRELFARVDAVLDVKILHTQPQILGVPESIQ
jgi:SanA protein